MSMQTDLTPQRRLDEPVIDDTLVAEGPGLTEELSAGVAQNVAQGAPEAEAGTEATGGNQALLAALTGGKGGKDVVTLAMSALGTPYVWGGNSLTRGVDCSGFTQQLFAAAGKQIPRTAAQQQKYARAVNAKQAQPGDLVFWQVTGSKDRVPGADHVGVYVGNGMVAEASSSQGRTVVRPLWGNYSFGRVV